VKWGSKRFWICFLGWELFFHSWYLAYLLPEPVLELLSSFAFEIQFFTAMLWINIPGIPLHYTMGDRYFPVEAFGALPQGVIGYGLIVLFWTVVAGILARITNAAIGWLQRRRARQTPGSLSR